MKHQAAIIDLAAFAASSDALVEIQLCPPGNVRNENRPFVMDKDIFDAIHKEWKKMGRELVIDYEHQTLPKYNTRPDGKAPAAGWITDIKWDDDKGMIGLVRWTKEAAEEIKSGAYKYLSPVFSIPDGSFRPTKFWSAALTNEPAIHGMAALAANRRKVMSKKKTATPFAARLLGKNLYDRVIAFEPEEMPGELDEGVGGLESALNGLKEYLVNAGKCGSDADPMSVLEAAANALAGMKAESPAELAIANKARTDLCERLSLKSDATFADIVGKVDSLKVERVPAAELVALKSKLESLEAAETERKANALVQQYKAEGKLLDADAEQIQWAFTLAKKDPENFKELMSKAPKRFEPGVVMKGGVSNVAKTERQAVIREAATAYKSSGSRFSMRNYINEALVIKGEKLVTDEEIKIAETN